MSFEPAFRTLMATDESVSALVGNRIFASHLPEQTEFPAVTYFVVSELPTRAMQGPSRLYTTLVQVSCWATPTESTTAYEAARRLQLAIRDCLDGATYEDDEIHIQSISEDSSNGFEPDPDSDIWHIALTFRITYKRK